MKIVVLELDCIFLPETLGVNRAPLQIFAVDLSNVFVERAEDPDIGLKNRANVLDHLNKFFILYISFKEGINNLQ